MTPERLRELADRNRHAFLPPLPKVVNGALLDGADEIERLTSERDHLRAVLDLMWRQNMSEAEAHRVLASTKKFEDRKAAAVEGAEK